MIYIFDFDGVLFDTVNELGVLTYCSLKNLPMNLKNVPTKFLNYFSLNRPRPVNGLGMVALGKWCLKEFEAKKEPYLISKKDFDLELTKIKGNSKEIENTFFNNRYSFMTENKDIWLSLNKPYPTIWKFLKNKNFYIVSNKDRNSLNLLSTHFGKILNSNLIFSSDERGSKAEKIFKIYQKEKQNCIFVDDALDNLIRIKEELSSPSWLSLYLAGWGYINPEDKNLLKKYTNIKLLKDEKSFLELTKKL